MSLPDSTSDLSTPPTLSISCNKREIYRGDSLLSVTINQYRLIVFLAINAHRSVTRAELRERIWQGVHVTPHAIDATISLMRKRLDPDKVYGRDAYVYTVPAGGYRMGVVVKWLDEEVPEPIGKDIRFGRTYYHLEGDAFTPVMEGHNEHSAKVVIGMNHLGAWRVHPHQDFLRDHVLIKRPTRKKQN